MRCPECRQEVVLARVCPYCGASVPQAHEEPARAGPEGTDRSRGRFQGRLNAAGSGAGPASAPRAGGFLGRLARYMLDPYVPIASKLLVILGGLYLLSPLDLLPGLPPISWVDDLGMIGVMGWWLAREFRRYG